jgi:hypothetical protein
VHFLCIPRIFDRSHLANVTEHGQGDFIGRDAGAFTPFPAFS